MTPRLPATLEGTIARFAAGLRAACGFTIGPGEEIDALRALEIVGLEGREPVRLALRSIFCAGYEDIAVFDRMFERFFASGPQGAAQSRYTPRHTLSQPGRPRANPRGARQTLQTARRPNAELASDSASTNTLQRSAHGSQELHQHQLVGARAGAIALNAEAPAVVVRNPRALLAAADMLLRRLHFGRTRRWHSAARGPRFDLRSTLRASLRTAGEPFVVRRLGHPHRNPRIVVALDASRSMEGQREEMLRFAWALAQRSERTNVFLFSTGLRDVTRALREPAPEGCVQLPELFDAWGGGTRIGASLRTMIRQHGHRILGRDSLVVIFSDGLDVGEPELLRSAMRELRRKTAGVVWINPLLASPAYEPAARGMRAAIPFVTSFLPATDALGMGELIAAQRMHLTR